MEYLIIALLILVVVGLGLVFLRLRKEPEKQNSDSLLMLQQQLNQISQVLDNKLSESAKAVQTQFSQSAKIIRDVTERLTKLDDTNKQVVGFAQQLQSLEDVLKNPKQRGILGEYYLEIALKNILPPSAYQLQYEFDDGDIVDAVIFVKDKIIPIDSKFSLENYNRIIQAKDKLERQRLEKQFKADLKNRIDETAKYIKPNKGTVDFALMFIPSESIYYDLLVNKIGAIKINTRDLLEYAVRDKKVMIVSPNSFHAYLQTILQGLKALQIEESAKEIRKGVEKLDRHLKSYSEYMKKLGANLGTTVNMYNQAGKEWGKIGKDVTKVTGHKAEMLEGEIEQLEKPKTD
jgi:DNA recombination protein RmuC